MAILSMLTTNWHNNPNAKKGTLRKMEVRRNQQIQGVTTYFYYLLQNANEIWGITLKYSSTTRIKKKFPPIASTLITTLYDFRIERTTRDSETVLNSLQSECNRDSVALFV